MDIIKDANIMNQEDLFMFENHCLGKKYTLSRFIMPRQVTVLMLLISYFDEHKYNHLNVLKKYIKRVPKEIHKECNGITPLFLGILYSDVGMVKILLENGADINKPLTDTSLFFHNEYIMKLLLEYDAYIITKHINAKYYNQAIKVIDNIRMLNILA